MPLDFFCPVPDPWLSVPEHKRATAGYKIDEDLCMIADESFFVRGCVEIPVIGQEEVFVWGVWVSLAEQNFKRVLDLWNANVDQEPAMFGWLCNNIKIYQETFGLKTNILLRNNGLRPLITLEPTDHPFALDQRNGITLERLEQIVVELMPRH